MYWFSRPPYLRYALAAVVLMTAIWLDLRPAGTVQVPFAGSDIAIGDQPSTADIEWADVPEGVVPRPVTPNELATTTRFGRNIDAGDPILASDLVEQNNGVPADWWILAMDLPLDTRPGQNVQLVVLPAQGLDPPAPIPAVIVRPGRSDSGLFGSSAGAGQVAVPPEHAATAAAAVADNRVSVLLAVSS